MRNSSVRSVDECVEVWEVPKGVEKTEEEIHAQHIEEDEYLESGMGKRAVGPRRDGDRRVLSWEPWKMRVS